MSRLFKNPILDAVVDTIVDSAVVIDKYGVILTVNKSCLEIFGYSRGSLIGSNVSLFMPEPDRSGHDDYIQNYNRTGQAQIIGIGRHLQGLRSSGEIFPLHLAIGEMEIEGERLFLGIIRDLSEEKARKDAYEELQSRHFHLSRVAAMNEMGAAIAHEINQPLTASANYLETARILIQRMDGTTALIQKDKIDNMLLSSVEQNKRASEIISRMRRFIENREAQVKVFNLEPIIEEAILLGLTGHVSTKPVFQIEIDEEAKFVLGDPVQIQQVLVNLIRNAADAMKEKQIRNLDIFLREDPENEGFVRIEIYDTGVGVSGDEMDQLFQPFVTSKEDGMGVGLSISQSIVKAMGGRIWAMPRPNDGMKFAFTLPKASDT